MSEGVWLPLILMLQSCKFFKVILEAQVTQICSMDILRCSYATVKYYQSWLLSLLTPTVNSSLYIGNKHVLGWKKTNLQDRDDLSTRDIGQSVPFSEVPLYTTF